MRGRTARFRYGSARSQRGTIRSSKRPTSDDAIVIVHGGSWRWPYGRWSTWLVARDAAARGHSVLNLGYRRLGRFGGGGGWPATFDDVSDGVAAFARSRPGARIVLVGHSAGGHLALVAASRLPEIVTGVVAIAAPTDLRALAERGSRSVQALVADAPSFDRWERTSPIDMLPTGVPVVCVHSEIDKTVRPSMSSRYVAAARAVGDDARLVRIEADAHRDALRPGSETWERSIEAAEQLLTARSEPLATSTDAECGGGRRV